MTIEILASSCTVTRRNRYLTVTLEDIDQEQICDAADLITKTEYNKLQTEYNELKDSLEDEITNLTDRIDSLEKRLIES
jgi:hypothetical protein